MNDYINNSTLLFVDRFIQLLSTYICVVFLFTKFSSIKLTTKKILILSLSGITLSIVIQLFGDIINISIKLLYYLLVCIALILVNRDHIYSAICNSIVNLAVVLFIRYISVFITVLFLFTTKATNNQLLSTIISCVLQILACLLLSLIKKLKKCFVYFEDETHAGIGLLLSSYIFIFSFLLTQQIDTNIGWGISLLIISPLILVGLFLWIRSIVNNHFKRKIADRADAFTQQEIKEKDERIEQLEAEVATLAKQVHRDNHLLSSLDRSVQTLAKTESAAEREQLADEFRTLYRERNDLIAKEQQERKLLPSTGVALIDGALSEMYVKATAHGIHFDLMVGEPIHYLVNNIISQTDLQTLLCDHIKDAIIAVDAAKGESGKILVSIEKHEGLFKITIRDNGVDFTPDTLAKLGKERVTTHAEEGGSGIGFMTTFETLEKTKGSLIITEHESKTPFSKSVAFVFDGLHQFIISSYRKDELKEKLSRDDILYL